MLTKALLMFIGYFVIQFGGALLLINVGQLAPDMASFVISIVILVFALYLYGGHLKAEWHRFRQQEPKIGRFILRLFGFYLLMLVLRVVLLMVAGYFVDIEALGQNQDILNEAAASLPMIATLILVAIYAPIVEELVFREAMIGVVDRSKKWLLVLMTLVSMLLFTYLHSFTLADFALYLPITLILTYIYWRYERNVITSIMFHFINNLIAVILMFYMLFTGTLL